MTSKETLEHYDEWAKQRSAKMPDYLVRALADDEYALSKISPSHRKLVENTIANE